MPEIAPGVKGIEKHPLPVAQIIRIIILLQQHGLCICHILGHPGQLPGLLRAHRPVHAPIAEEDNHGKQAEHQCRIEKGQPPPAAVKHIC